MAKVEKITIALTQEMAAKVRAAVERGDYASTSEVIRDALRDWDSAQMAHEREIERLGQLWDEGIASGEPIPAQEVIDSIRAKLAARIAKAA